ncbi:hypothetical protein E2C01_082706 [Portunus trituberculatus]|uniref:Uncharacterized protein n=1 Tax=Portunus trituberculatus TaxID=210409 RepID=A0A5B7J4H4_PORTR|nr:hypothetical protein [Portunus trituberculatus]
MHVSHLLELRQTHRRDQVTARAVALALIFILDISKATAFIFSSTKQNEKYKQTEPGEWGGTEDESNVAQCDWPTPPVSSTLLKPYQDLTCLSHSLDLVGI